MLMVRVRFAPSPTGELHIGGARTALFNYLFARANGGVFILRIDDTDQERSRPEYAAALLEALKWLGLEWDEGPYYQSERLSEYNREAARLLEEGKAYHCYCSPEEIQEQREAARKAGKLFRYPGTCRDLSKDEMRAYEAEGRSPVIRLRVPESGNTVVDDIIRGRVTFANDTLDDYIIVKSNGLPTYNFASVVDDHLLGITHVIRAEEHLSNTPRQLLCATALGYRPPRYAHVPMILAPDRSKLSKRHGATSVEEFCSQGYLPEALVNYMALLGWSPGEEEILTLEEMAKIFSLDRIGKNAAIYDTVKLTWMNGHYLMQADPAYLSKTAYPFFEAEGLLKGPLNESQWDYLRTVIETVRERVKTLAELPEACRYFYEDDFDYDPKGVQKIFTKDDTALLLRQAAARLAQLDRFDYASTERAYHDLSAALEISAVKLIQPSRLALTGRTGGPELFAIMAVLGKEKTLQRLEKAAAYIEAAL
ncbi:MAG TPA: glutamate--tRNA ligase [Bacillota bacterium]|nr:glutamate--tRNA ligase [Bacillota bacterium]